ncbi:hypothetical protein NG798_24170 [Ancylothrix sp. C2]|uniref:CU044_2847 family protein n=1 Tax=Ancylothrix sp. D3o TaxID=2953691 RepID=UPI0021BAAFA9|nr:CU044_2847 family protein [Ancylothrix sp. D3o]MCT7952900.1 hypothetical protein [Ancylothrix sp. D3o]
MANLVPIEDDKGNQIYIEVIPTGNQSGIKQTSKDTGVADKLTADDFKRMIRQAVMPTCQTFVDVWQELNQPLTADGAEVEFNLGFTASGNAVLMQASGQASFKVKVSWKFSPSENLNLLPVSRPISNISNILSRSEGVDFRADLESASTSHTSPESKDEDLKADLKSLESEIQTFKEASRTGSNDFNRDEEIEKIRKKAKNIKLSYVNALSLTIQNCDSSRNCDKNKPPKDGGCCLSSNKFIQDLHSLEYLENAIEEL